MIHQAHWEKRTMADQAFRSTDGNSINSTNSEPRSFDKAASSAKNVADQALSAGRELKNKAVDMAGSSTEALKDQASEFVDAAKDVASQTTDKFKEIVDGQKTAGAEYVGSLADTMRRAANEFDNDLPIAGTYIRKAASQMEVVSDSIKKGGFICTGRSRVRPAATDGIPWHGSARRLRRRSFPEEFGRNSSQRRL
jgi:hypothetical protein